MVTTKKIIIQIYEVQDPAEAQTLIDSDFFLTDTIRVNGSDHDGASQPVSGFVGITGQICSWRTALGRGWKFLIGSRVQGLAISDFGMRPALARRL